MTVTKPRPTRRPLVMVVLAGSAITSVVIGVRLTFGLYLDPVIETIGTDRGTYALAIAIQNIMWGASQPVAGAIADRFGSARVLAVGAIGYMGSMLIMASATTTGMLLLSTGFLVGISTGAASFAVVLSAVGRMAPPERRSMALGIVTAMGSVGQFVLVPATQRLLAATTWQTTVAVLGLVVASAALFAPPFRGRATDHIPPDAIEAGQDHGLGRELRRALHHRPYLLVNLAFFVCGFHVTFIGTHLPAYVGDLGIDRAVAATALSLIGLFNIAGSLAAGVLGGRYSKTRLLSIIYASRAAVIALYVLLPTTATTTVLFGATFGLLWLSTVPLTSGIVTGQFGTRHSGALFGIVFFAHQLGAFTGVWMGGELADSTGSYRIVWLIALGLGIMAAVVHLLIDEGPAPLDPVPAKPGLGLAPAGAAAVIVLTGAAAVAPAVIEDGGRPAAASPPPVVFCPLHAP